LVQITETVPPEVLFRHYRYFSSVSDSFLHHAEVLASELVVRENLTPSSSIVEIASNDGYLLRHYRERGIQVLGIEPAENVARVAREKHGVPTLCEFFGEGLATQLAGQGVRADVVHAHNVLAHVAELHGFVRGIRILLKETGVAIVEVPYVRDMVDNGEVDTIYHEHLCYFSVTSLARLFSRNGLALSDVKRLAVHGGSLRLAVRPIAGCASRSVATLLEEESAWRVQEVGPYHAFASRVEEMRLQLRGFLAQLAKEGKRIAAYGAAAKAAILLNLLALEPGTVSYVVDRSPHKQGLFMPGVHLPIREPSVLLADQPDFVLLLAWNLADEIVGQQEEYRRRGGRFIVPLPKVRLV
jgi:SAM-dependent methyltransferase